MLFLVRSTLFGFRGLVVSLGLVLFALSGTGLAENSQRPFVKGPYLQAPGADTMTVIWESPTNGVGLLRYGLDGRLDQEVQLHTPRELVVVSTTTNNAKLTNSVFLYELTLTNLAPSSVYTYSAEMLGIRTAPRSFKTFGTRPDQVTFIAYGDTRSNPKMHGAIAGNFKAYRPDFILHTGDLVGAGKQYDLWGREFFEPLAGVIDEIPMLPAIGNHEQDGLHYLHYLHLPGKGNTWYSYDVGPVHVLSLDFRYERESDPQFAFAKQDLENSTAPWKVVFLHVPCFNMGGHGSRWGHAAYLPLFHRTKVDLIVGGHSHIYERFRPIAPAAGSNSWPIVHITTGGGGAPVYAAAGHPALASYLATNHFIVIEATKEKLTGRALSAENVLLDSFVMRKEQGELSAEFLAQTYPEELLNLSFDLGRGLAGELRELPGTNSAVKVRLDLRLLADLKEPGELEIELKPESRAHYRLERPLRIALPLADETQYSAWANVSATGLKAIETTGTKKELSPILAFQAALRVGTNAAVAYGQRSRMATDTLSDAK